MPCFSIILRVYNYTFSKINHYCFLEYFLFADSFAYILWQILQNVAHLQIFPPVKVHVIKL